MKKFDFLNEYVDFLMKNDKFIVADSNRYVNNIEFYKIVNSIAKAILNFKTDRQLSVVILLDRNIYYIASMFATWLCDSYFIPLNIKWPKERINSIIKHCAADIVICSKSIEYNFENILFIEDIYYSDKVEKLGINLKNNPSNIAYIIYTSGSTGIPKGVMIKNESYLSYVKWTSRFFHKFKKNRALLLTSELTFDITLGDIAFALSFGTSIIVSPDPKNVISHAKLINRYNVDTLYSVPTTHNALFNFVKNKRNANISTLKLIISGGDSFSDQLIKLIKEVLPDCEFYNVYGPTEVTINCFATRVDNLLKNIEKTKLVPIGRPFDIIDAVLIDEKGKDVTNKHIVGKLFVNGIQVMLGYLDDEDKTTDAFVLDPRYPKFKRKLYNTGDLAVKKENGLFYLLGRSDDIVKIKGYRVNPTEINNVILKFPTIKESVVFPVNDNKIYKLISCLVVKKYFNIELLRMHILNLLPEYMLPSRFILVDAMPLNNSGKIDKKILKEKFLSGEFNEKCHDFT